MPKAIRLAPSLVALLLSCSALSSSAQAGWFSSDDPKPAAAPKNDKPAPVQQPAATLDDSIHQAQQLRLAGKYNEAINHLSQVMLVAADDGRVISEYGKTLVSMGRADEGLKFLTRAQQLLPNDWSVYSALGVAYDQTGDQQNARANYEHALALKPGEPSVLSNYAFSRMLAKDPAGARKLADRAEVANAVAPDDKITRNIAMVRSMAPQTDNFAVNTPAPSPVASSAPMAAPHVAVAAAPLPAPVQHAQAAPIQTTPQVARPVPAAMASSAQPAANSVIQAQPQVAQMLNQQPRGVVMQAVPVDPLAGPVATRAPRTLQPKAEASNDAVAKPMARPDMAKPAVEAAAKPVSAADSLEARAEAIAKTLNKPGAIAQAKAEANKGEVSKAEVSKAAKPAVPAATAAKVSVPVKAADVKPNTAPAAPKVLPPASVKAAADAKPATAKTAAAKPASKDAIPGLRLSANAY
jgi:Flp pilus assembly protein TadD